MSNPIISIIMGSESDRPIMEKAGTILNEFELPFEIIVSSAHRMPAKTTEFAATAKERGIKVIIAGAGMAAHLPGVVAAQTTLPVIGVPIASGALHGIDALYSIVQMPSGVPVATVGVDNAKNAAFLAIQMLALSDPDLEAKIIRYRQKLSGV